jgi:hypothetical protein
MIGDSILLIGNELKKTWSKIKDDLRLDTSGANPTTLIYNATGSLARFESYFFVLLWKTL